MTIPKRDGGRDWRILGLFIVLLLVLGNLSSHDRFLRAARNPDPNRADMEAGAGGYYVGLIDGGSNSSGRPKNSWGDLSPLLIGKPANWARFADAGVATPEVSGFLQFRLNPGVERDLYGKRFSTNSFRMRDRDYALAKPSKTFRIALLGSSIDMGWGVGDSDVYEHRLETWLNGGALAQAGENHGDPSRDRPFEVLNFAVAAYGPAQRLAVFEDQASRFQPDLAIYSATMLDPRLAELHLRGLLTNQVDLRYGYLRKIVDRFRIVVKKRSKKEAQLVRDDGSPLDLEELRWAIIEESVDELAAVCRQSETPLWMMIVPRVGAADAPEVRAQSVRRYRQIAQKRQIPVLDLSPIFDHRKRASLEIAAWDDHPNAEGHRLLFQALKEKIASNPALCRVLFDEPIP